MHEIDVATQSILYRLLEYGSRDDACAMFAYIENGTPCARKKATEYTVSAGVCILSFFLSFIFSMQEMYVRYHFTRMNAVLLHINQLPSVFAYVVQSRVYLLQMLFTRLFKWFKSNKTTNYLISCLTSHSKGKALKKGLCAYYAYRRECIESLCIGIFDSTKLIRSFAFLSLTFYLCTVESAAQYRRA